MISLIEFFRGKKQRIHFQGEEKDEEEEEKLFRLDGSGDDSAGVVATVDASVADVAGVSGDDQKVLTAKEERKVKTEDEESKDGEGDHETAETNKRGTVTTTEIDSNSQKQPNTDQSSTDSGGVTRREDDVDDNGVNSSKMETTTANDVTSATPGACPKTESAVDKDNHNVTAGTEGDVHMEKKNDTTENENGKSSTSPLTSASSSSLSSFPPPPASFEDLVQSLSRYFALGTDGDKFVDSILRRIVLQRRRVTPADLDETHVVELKGDEEEEEESDMVRMGPVGLLGD